MGLSHFRWNKLWPYRLILIVTSLLVLTGGYLFYNSQRKKIQDEKQIELAAIISLKTEEIARWRAGHIRDGRIISNDKLLIDQISYFFEKDTDAVRNELLSRMDLFIKDYDYKSFYILDNTGTVRLSFPSPDPAVNNFLNYGPAGILEYNTVGITELQVSEDSSDISLDVVIPLITSDNARTGIAVLRIDPEITLFPLIQTWPSPSKSSETLLLRRDGDSVLFLNDLRHQKNTALRLRFPMSKTTLPAAMAVLGYEGPFEGLDYRNIPVISYLKKIPHSLWYMVAKVDKKEIYSPLYEQIVLITLIIFLIIFSAGITIGFFLRNHSLRLMQELNTTKDKFFSIISHDLRSPFNSIVGFSELLIDRIKDRDYNETEKFASIINVSSQLAMNLLTNLTQWSRLQTGRMKFNPRETDLVAIINEVCDLLDASAFQKSLTLRRNIPASLKIVADEAMISSILRNLISNSIKFSNPGGEIDISVCRKDNKVIIIVGDNGVGIKKDVLTKLFRIEAKISTPGTLNEEGTGLGLILCKEFILKHSGEIRAESEHGSGSKFTVTLPVH